MAIHPAFRFALAGLLAAASVAPAMAVVGPSEPGAPLAAGIVMVLNHAGREAGFCTGVVLTATVVMTAAHCAPPGADLRVHFPDPGRDPVLLPVSDVARHPGYRADAIHTRQRSIDLALIRLRAPLPARFSPLELEDRAGAEPGDLFTLSGYGVGREGDPASSGQLRSAALVAHLPRSEILLWAGDPDKRGSGACKGDSGAPITRRGAPAVAALAVWSAGSGARRCGELTQSLWIAPQKAWIAGVLRAWQGAR